MSRDDGFLDRWSRRKRAVTLEEDAPASPAADPAPPQVDETLSEAELLAELGLPDPDTLQEGDDFTVFLKEGVPEFLKKRALRKLWLTNPALANLDGLLDYGEDFTDAAMVPEVLATAYKVGKGLLKDVIDEPEALHEKTHGINQDSEPLAQTEPAPAGPPPPEPHEDVNDAEEPVETEEETLLRPRRMAFRYD
ncbi:MAG: DUF3306 domain-containing protein [Rhodobacter sp.]|nr:DUF3306 domain-containing protein [Rhodobacter sp.]